MRDLAKMSAALTVINGALGLAAEITIAGDEVKCHVPDEDDDGTTKRYLDAEQCAELSRAFKTLAVAMRKP